MIHTKRLVMRLRGLNLEVEPNMMISPRGMAPSSVTANSRSVCRKPTFSAWKTTGNCWRNVSICLPPLRRNEPPERSNIQIMDG